MAGASNLTEAIIRKAVEADVATEVRLYDAKVPGLILWRRPNGKARWYLFRRVSGKMKRMPVGDGSTTDSINLETARELGRTLIGRLAAGDDVTAERQAKRAKINDDRNGGKAPLVDALTIHLKTLADRGRDGGHVAELKRVVTAAIAAGAVDLANPQAVVKAQKWLASLDVSEPTRHRYRVHLCAVSKTALKNWPADILPRDPFLALTGEGVTLPPPPVFDPVEAITLVSDAALALPGGRLWAFLLLTGCRFKEATWARWDRINLGRATFDVVPPDAAEYAAGSRVKRMKPRTVALPAELVALLTTWNQEANPSAPFLFAAEWRTRPHVYNTFSFRNHLKTLQIHLNDRKIHSLRHTRQTIGIACGEDSLRLRLSMGHAGEDMGAHYGRLAMRWRGLLGDWNGELKLRDPAEVERIQGTSNPSIAARAVSAIDSVNQNNEHTLKSTLTPHRRIS